METRGIVGLVRMADEKKVEVGDITGNTNSNVLVALGNIVINNPVASTLLGAAALVGVVLAGVYFIVGQLVAPPPTPTPVGLIETQIALVLAATQTEAVRLTEVAALPTVMDADPTATATLPAVVEVVNTPVPVLPTFTDTATPTETRPPSGPRLGATRTATPTNTSAATVTPTRTATATTTAMATPDPYAVALGAAEGFAGGNDDWEPVTWVLEDDPTGATMVLVPPGCFMMGSETYDDEQPVHEQCFEEPFWIDETEVTRGQWQACVDAGVCRTRETNQYSERDLQPVNNVSWYDAVTFCEWRGARLPMEREWEYAAAGPDGLVYPWGDTFNGELVVYSGNSGNQTADVGSRSGGVSWVGALDLSGNVWEWVSSKYLPYPYALGDGREDLTGDDTRVLRGGSFVNFVDVNLRAAIRLRNYPAFENNFNGFRCARSP